MTSKYLINFFAARIEDAKQTVVKNINELDKLQPDCYSTYYYSIAFNARSIAIYTFLLGNIADARDWFETSAEYYIKNVDRKRLDSGFTTWIDEPETCKQSLYMAVFSDKPELIKKSVNLSLSIPERDPAQIDVFSQIYHYLIALSNFLNNDIPKATLALDKLIVSDDLPNRMYNEGLKNSLQGLILNDNDRFVNGLDILLRYHNRHFYQSKTAFDIISMDVSVLIKIAIGKGLAIGPGDEKCYNRYILWKPTLADSYTRAVTNITFYSTAAECNKRYFEDVLEHFEELGPKEAYRCLGDFGSAAAIFKLLSGKKPEAIDWFKKAAEYYANDINANRSASSFNTWEGDARRCNDALNMAILSGDKEIIDNSLRLSLGISSYFFRYNRIRDCLPQFYYLKARTNLLAGNTEKAMESLRLMVHERWKKCEGYYNGLKIVILGLMSDSKSEILVGLNTLLTFHDEQYAGSDSADEIISLDATAMIIIAREHGIVVTPGDLSKGLEKYIPWNLLE